MRKAAAQIATQIATQTATQTATQMAAPDAAQAHYNLGVQLQSAQRLPEAAQAYRKALALQAGHVEAHINLGNVLASLGQGEQALACYREAMALRPDWAELQLNVGGALQELGRHEEAIAGYREALARQPASVLLSYALGAALRKRGAHEEAARWLEAAVQADPRLGVAHAALGETLRELGRLPQAVHHLQHAAALDARDGELRHGLGDALMDLGRRHEAMAAYREAIAAEPASAASHSGLLMKLLYDDAATPLRSWLRHRRYAERFESPLAAAAHEAMPAAEAQRRLKVGYVSPDFREHSVAYFIEPILARHDRQAFEIHCYCTSLNEDAATLRLRALADRWSACAELDDAQLAETVQRDGIDVLVDLSGHSAGNRLLMFARRAAPVQLTWIGYPGPTGLRRIDGFITDARLSPPGYGPDLEDAGYEQGLVRLPRVFSCYRPPGQAPEPASPAASTGNAQGPAALTLGSFNNAAKISDRILALWSRILQALPPARLLLKDRQFSRPAYRDAFLGRLSALGVAPERAELLGRLDASPEHLAAYGRVDIALDTYPYCGVTTTCEALWMGVPVVSLAGESPVSRMGASLLGAIGHPEWVAGNEEEYLDAVLALARDPGQRLALRHGLRTQLSASPLLDEAGFTAELEEAYRRLWAQRCTRDQRRASPDFSGPGGGAA